MAVSIIPDSVAALFAAITGDLEDAAAMAATAQSIRNRAEAIRAKHQIGHALGRIEQRLAKLEALLV